MLKFSDKKIKVGNSYSVWKAKLPKINVLLKARYSTEPLYML